jgi:peptidoglycan/LPS O-acetylase OafA/YrhL
MTASRRRTEPRKDGTALPVCDFRFPSFFFEPYMSLIQNFPYRPEIDGLRAVAVLAVVLFHAGLGVPGGFVGVDVFFVISGFLITSLILKDLQAGTFSLAHFWERRARRIIPAAVVMVMVVLMAGWFLLLPSDYAAAGKSAGMHALFASNFHFWRSTNYFASSADEQPLLHTWSLAVEEQFYIIVPFLLLLLFRYPLFRRRGPLLVLLIPAFMISLALSVFLLPRAPAATFYLLPTRAWELLAGSIVALLPAVSLSRLCREVLCGLALAAILIPCFLYHKETPFPGLAALPSCLGTCLLIWASSDSRPGARAPLSAVGSLLSSKPLVFIGLISYSLYLWHWPLFAFSTYWALEPSSASLRGALGAASVVLAILSWRFVETPFRVRRCGSTRTAMFAWGFGGLTVSAACALVLVFQTGFPRRFSDRILAIDAAKNESFWKSRLTKAVTLDDSVHGRFPRLGALEPAPVRLMVWGDSHAGSILPAIDSIAQEHSMVVLTAWYSSTPPVLGYQPVPRAQDFSLGKDCPVFNQMVIDYVARERIPAVLLVARWSEYLENESTTGLDSAQGSFATALLETVKRIRAVGAMPYLLMEVPNHKVPVPKALLSREILGTDLRPYTGNPHCLAERNREIAALIPSITAAGARIIDVSDSLFDGASGFYLMERDGTALYFDTNHLTQDGALFVRDSLAPLFEWSGKPNSMPAPAVSGH